MGWWVLALVGCAAESGGGGADTGPSAAFWDIDVDPAPVGTVLTVTFTTDGEGPGPVEFGPEGGGGWTVAAEEIAPATWRARLVGLPEDHDAWLAVGAGAARGPRVALHTEAAPDWARVIDVVEGELSPGFVVTCVKNGEERGAVILDRAGRTVWWYRVPDDIATHVHSRARLTPDGEAIVFNAFSLLGTAEPDDGESVLVRVPIEGWGEERIATSYNHHDLVAHEDGTLAWIDVDQREIDGEMVRGDRIVERAPDGTEVVRWSTFDAFEWQPEENETSPPGWWTVANHLQYRVDVDAYVLSLRNFNALVQVDRASGRADWVLGVQGTLVPDDPFEGQHGFEVQDDVLVLFDNRIADAAGSRVVSYRLDRERGTATREWAYVPEEPLPVSVMGSASLLPRDHVLASFTTQGVLVELDQDGHEVGRATAVEGAWVTYAEHQN